MLNEKDLSPGCPAVSSFPQFHVNLSPPTSDLPAMKAVDTFTRIFGMSAAMTNILIEKELGIFLLETVDFGPDMLGRFLGVDNDENAIKKV